MNVFPVHVGYILCKAYGITIAIISDKSCSFFSANFFIFSGSEDNGMVGDSWVNNSRVRIQIGVVDKNMVNECLAGTGHSCGSIYYLVIVVRFC